MSPAVVYLVFLLGATILHLGLLSCVANSFFNTGDVASETLDDALTTRIILIWSFKTNESLISFIWIPRKKKLRSLRESTAKTYIDFLLLFQTLL